MELDQLRRVTRDSQKPISDYNCVNSDVRTMPCWKATEAAKSLAATRGLLKEMKILQEQIKKEEKAQEPHDTSY